MQGTLVCVVILGLLQLRCALSFGGRDVSTGELEAVEQLRRELSGDEGLWNQWVSARATDLDLMRFLRFYRHDYDRTAKALREHGTWRQSASGPDTILAGNQEDFYNSRINDEIFWIGPDHDGCPTAVVRSQLHNGADYDEDPVKFVRWVTWFMEQGRIRYGVGSERAFCLLMDRSPAQRRDGHIARDTFDFAIVPRLIDLVRNVMTVLHKQYPEIIYTTQIYPTNWFFSAAYRMGKYVLDADTRAKISTVSESELHLINGRFDAEVLPTYMGGSGTGFTRDTPERRKLRLKKKQQQREQEMDQNNTWGAWGRGGDGKSGNDTDYETTGNDKSTSSGGSSTEATLVEKRQNAQAQVQTQKREVAPENTEEDRSGILSFDGFLSLDM